MRPPTGNKISQKSHGATRAVDYSDEPDPYVYAPEDCTFDSFRQRGSGKLDAGLCLRVTGKNGLHQFGHLEKTYLTGGRAKKGQRIAKMGYTGFTDPDNVPAGRHLHYWLRRPNGTYVYPPSVQTEPFGGYPSAPKPKMPAVGSRIQLIPTDSRTTFKAGTTTPAGTIKVTDNSFVYVVRGYDKQYPNRIIINSASGGGHGVALALYLTNGTLITGWKTV